MISNPPTRSTASARCAPEDLRLALGQHGLAELVRETVPSRHAPTPSPDSSERLLALLTYSYAAGVYNSSEISQELDEDNLLRLLGTSLPLDHHVFRQFRRQNRSELRDCLSRVLRRAHATASPGYADWSLGRWLTVANDDFEEEAEERISRAIRADTFALDD
jgi:hypothetical protein